MHYDGTHALLNTHCYLYDGMGNQVYDYVVGTTDIKYSIYDGHNTQLALYTYQLPGVGIDNVLFRFFPKGRTGTANNTRSLNVFTLILPNARQ